MAHTTYSRYLNIRFVIREASKYQGHGLKLEDLISEGIVGLIKAVDHFDLTRDARLITCAAWWIRDEILQSINNCGMSHRMTDKDYRLLLKVHKALAQTQQIEDEKERMELVSELAGTSEEKVSDILKEAAPSVSGDKSFDSDDNSNLFSIMKDTKSQSPEDYAMRECFKEDLLKTLASLPEMERSAFIMYHGIFGSKEYNFSEIGQRYGRTKQWAFLKAHAAEKAVAEKMSAWAA